MTNAPKYHAHECMYDTKSFLPAASSQRSWRMCQEVCAQGPQLDSNVASCNSALFNHLYADFGGRHMFLSVGQNKTEEHIMHLQSGLLEKLCGDTTKVHSLEEGNERLSNALSEGSKVFHRVGQPLGWKAARRPAAGEPAKWQLTYHDSAIADLRGAEGGSAAGCQLPDQEALELLCLHAFCQPAP